jgi:hypothetical protein
VEHWDGRLWRVVSTPDVGPSALYDVAALGPDDIWAVGGTNYPSRTLVEHDSCAWHGRKLGSCTVGRPWAAPLNLPPRFHVGPSRSRRSFSL